MLKKKILKNNQKTTGIVKKTFDYSGSYVIV
nr:MAG TPA: hypothetical protein [Caudoviricetes sp.]